LTKKEAENLIDNAMAYKYETSKHILWYDRKSSAIIVWIIVGILTYFFVTAFSPNKLTEKELLLQQRERIYSEIYE